MRSLILGASGRLGGELYWEARWRGHECAGTRFRGRGRGLIRLDLRDGPTTSVLVRSFRPEVVFVAAGLSDPHEAESHPDACLTLRRDGVIQVAQAVRSLYGDEDYPRPRLVCFSGATGSSVLCRAEAMAEEALQLLVPDQHLIVRAGLKVTPLELAAAGLDLAEGGRVGTCHVGEVIRPVLRAVA